MTRTDVVMRYGYYPYASKIPFAPGYEIVGIVDAVLITGASGGVGTALLQLGKVLDLKMYGTASRGKHNLLIEWGASPIDYRAQDFVEVIRRSEAQGVDGVFEGIGGATLRRSFSVVKRGGRLVAYGNTGFLALLRDLAILQAWRLLPNGKSGEFYGITA